MESVFSVLVGLGLAAACGFRVFVPLLVLGIASRAGAVGLHEGMEWLASWPAIIAFATAAALEVGAYWIPWIDHALDVVATPAAVVAGTVVAASQFADTSPFLQWSGAIVAGGGVAGTVQASSVITRAASTVGTAGTANPLISTLHSAASAVLAVVAVVAPVLGAVALVAVLALVVWVLVRAREMRRRRAAAPRI